MEFVSRINQAIENDRFVLDCQKICGDDPQAGKPCHYEILLTVLDENDNPCRPTLSYRRKRPMDG
ncbi:MAG: hypothetical protein U5O39_08175 [Gammaproteobacteria bacterium]|nr:hypothetical protein [Gammaproteobacteria bacterium]